MVGRASRGALLLKVVASRDPALDKVMLGELINLISGIAPGVDGAKARDLLGRVWRTRSRDCLGSSEPSQS